MPVITDSRVGRDQLQANGWRSVHCYATDSAGHIHRRRMRLPKEADATAELAAWVATLETEIPAQEQRCLNKAIQAGQTGTTLDFLSTRSALRGILESFLSITDPRCALTVAKWIEAEIPTAWVDDHPDLKQPVLDHIARVQAMEAALDGFDAAIASHG